MEPLTKDVQRPVGQVSENRRKDRPRSRTIASRRLTRAEIEDGKRLVDYMWYERPQTRADCVDGPRPCAFVSCKYHLYLDVKSETRSIKINFPHLEVWEMEESCSLDVAKKGGLTLEEVGRIMNLTRERIRQVEAVGMEKLRGTGLIGDIDRVFGNGQKFS
jgi:hypothetical protein